MFGLLPINEGPSLSMTEGRTVAYFKLHSGWGVERDGEWCPPVIKTIGDNFGTLKI